jgi:dihydrofolate synthase/folylpolyglutamate synthase
VKMNERIAIDGESVSDETLVTIWNEIEPIVHLVDSELENSGEQKLTFFEVLSVLAFAIFSDAPIDVLVLEVGMGGEWDSTNIADGDVAVFTPISLDHMDRLGKTIEEIATTKSGIIKPGAIVLTASQTESAMSVLASKSMQIAEKLLVYGSDFQVTAVESTKLGQTVSIKSAAGAYLDLSLPIHGEFQSENAALAVAAVEAFIGGASQRIMDDVVRAAFSDFSSPGRLQIVGREPLIILDAAHNPHGANSLVNSLTTSFDSGFKIGVVSILRDKDAQEILTILETAFNQVIITQSESARAIPAEELGKLALSVFGKARVSVQANPEWALAEAKQLLPKDFGAAIVVTGSVTLVGQVLKLKQIEAEQDA